MVSASGEICAGRRIEKRLIANKKMVVFILIRPVNSKSIEDNQNTGHAKTGIRKSAPGRRYEV
jgi:hypothetical protein